MPLSSLFGGRYVAMPQLQLLLVPSLLLLWGLGDPVRAEQGGGLPLALASALPGDNGFAAATDGTSAGRFVTPSALTAGSQSLLNGNCVSQTETGQV